MHRVYIELAITGERGAPGTGYIYRWRWHCETCGNVCGGFEVRKACEIEAAYHQHEERA